MNEYELAYLLSEAAGRIWTLINLWAGITLGYLAIANFGVERLTLAKVLVLSLLYVSFTLTILEYFVLNASVMAGYHSDLRELGANIELSSGTMAWLVAREESASSGHMMTFSVLVTFLVAVFYLPYSYWKLKRGNT